MLGVDIGRHAARGLCLGNQVLAESRLPRRLRSEDLADPPLGHPTNPESNVETQGPRRYRLDLHAAAGVPQPHDRPLSKLLFNLPKGQIQGLCFFRRHGSDNSTRPFPWTITCDLPLGYVFYTIVSTASLAKGLGIPLNMSP